MHLRLVTCGAMPSGGMSFISSSACSPCSALPCSFLERHPKPLIIAAWEVYTSCVRGCFIQLDSCLCADWDKVLGVNVKGYAFGVKHAAQAMIKAQRPDSVQSIIMISSISSQVAQPGSVALYNHICTNAQRFSMGWQPWLRKAGSFMNMRCCVCCRCLDTCFYDSYDQPCQQHGASLCVNAPQSSAALQVHLLSCLECVNGGYCIQIVCKATTPRRVV